MAVRTVAPSLAKSKTGLRSLSNVTWRARLIEPRLQTAVSLADVTSVISVHRFDRCTTLPSAPVWLHFRLVASLKVIQPLPVSASDRIIRAYKSRALIWRW
jgi:hypothetical protein